jgi:tRNA(His) 5'-end guanylyltransferase
MECATDKSINTNIVINANVNFKKEKLGDRMKKYENEVDSKIIIRPTESFIIRLDGRSFSKFTKKFVKPFDLVFVKAMCLTMRDLVQEFEAQTGYTHSDEITLIFDAKCSELEEFEYLEKKINNDEQENNKHKTKINELSNHMFRGRIQKILSLTSSFCSVRFNYHLSNLIEPIKSNYDDKFVDLIKSHKQMFDGRIIIFDESRKHEILNHQIWRSIQDCERNAISTYAHTYFGSKKIMNKTCKDMIQMLKDENNLSWDADIPLFIKHGVYCKKKLIEKKIDGKKVMRSDYIFKELKINFSPGNLLMLIGKYWNDVGNCGKYINLDELCYLR